MNTDSNLSLRIILDSTGSINKLIIEKIVNCELVIANLTSVNPNVMYELGIRHSFEKRVITVTEHGTKLPFDIIDQRTLFYSDICMVLINLNLNYQKL